MTADIYSKDGADDQFVHVVGTPTEGQTPVWNAEDEQWEPGDAAGAGVPDGGTTGQSLVKTSSTDGDAEWADRVATVNGLAPVDGNVNTAVLPGPLEKTPIYAYGHSYLAGVGTSGGRDIVSRLTQRTGTAVTNRAMTGASVSVALNRMHNLDGSASASVWVPGTKGVILFDSVTNDGRVSPDAVTVLSESPQSC
jgi:hypothetical protein